MAVQINGDGLITVDGTSTTQGRVRLAEDTDNGTNYVELTAPASVASNRTITFPDDTGTVLTNSGNQTGVFSALTVNSNNISADNSLGFRNRIINGDMRIDQRNAGASVTPTNAGGYTLDRWRFWRNGGGGSAAFTVQQSTTAPTGFTNSIIVTQTAAHSPTSSEYNIGAQYIEGFNVADFAWGTANAKTVTLSFWVRSSLTGTFGGALSNSAQDRSYPFTYTISSANTFEYKTITVDGDTSGTWLTTNGAGLLLFFQIGVGSTYLGTAGAWASAAYLGATGATNITATNGATFYITGVQLEVGSVATPFERRPFGTELFLCQRYYWVYTSNNSYIGILQAYTTSAVYGVLVDIPVPMRATPSVSQSGNFAAFVANSNNASLSTTITNLGTNGQNILTTDWGGGNGLVAGYAAVFQGATGAKLIASAEL